MINFGVLIISDRSFSGTRDDLSGPALVQAVENAGWVVVRREILPDEHNQIVKTLSEWADSGEFQVIITSGGTGFSARDVTPEATNQVIDRETPGLVEAMRADSLKYTPHGMLSRAAAGIRKKCLIINLPGSPKGALENFRVITPVLAHAVQLLEDDEGAEEGHRSSLAA
jgi:molybdenum cofactor synthesis domain-containing protein